MSQNKLLQKIFIKCNISWKVCIMYKKIIHCGTPILYFCISVISTLALSLKRSKLQKTFWIDCVVLQFMHKYFLLQPQELALAQQLVGDVMPFIKKAKKEKARRITKREKKYSCFNALRMVGLDLNKVFKIWLRTGKFW